MAREELYIGGVYIPLSKSLNASLNKSITDIQEPDKRKATYSKTVTIPNSKEAAEVFGTLFDLNIVDSSFDVTVKIDCRYVVDGEPIIEGYCQLKSINQKNRTDITYDIVMFSVLANIFRDMGEDDLNEIDLSRWNHPFTKEVQAYSWTTQVYDSDAAGFIPFAYGTGYVYPLADYGFSTDLIDFDFNQIPCAIYLKEYIDAIFAYTGKNYTSTFFDSTCFKKIVIPSSPTNFQLTTAEIDAKQFQANTPTFTSTGTTTSNNLPIDSFSASDTIIFGNEVADPSSLYNNTTGVYTIPSVTSQGLYDINALVDITGTFVPGTGTAVKTTSDILGYLMVHVNGVQAQAKPFYLTSDDATFFSGSRSTTASPTYPDGDYIVGKKYSVFPNNLVVDERTGDNEPQRYLLTLNNIQLYSGDTVEIKWKAGVFSKKLLAGASGSLFQDSGGTGYSGSATIDISVGAFYNKVVNTYPAEGSTMVVDKLIPKNVKMKDFFMSVVKKFNLWIDIDPASTNNYIIEPRDSFLQTDIIDIDNKLDEGQDLTIVPMGKVDIADYHFTDKPDKDYLNETYTSQHNERIYGDRKVLSTNEFTNKVKKIETIFSSTPLAAPANSDRVLSTIIQQNEMGYPLPVDHNVRMWFYDGLKSGKYWRHINYTSGWPGIPFPTTYTTYPYAGHFDDPYNATEDLNWGLTEEVYYDDNLNTITITNNNLVNKYYSKQLQEYTAKESKIVSGMFNVTPHDFKSWSFRKLYFFRGAYFRLQEISGYNPTGESLTKCTFLYLTNTPSFSDTPIIVDGDPIKENPDGTGGGTVTFEEEVPTKGTRTSQNLDYNNTTNRAVDIQGKYNYVAYDSHYIEIQGASNKVYSEAENIKIQGDNNTIDGGVKNVTLINTDGLTISESDVTYIDGVKVNAAAISSASAVEEISASQNVETDVKTYVVDTSGGDVTMTFDLAIITYTEGQDWTFYKDSSSNNMIISIVGGTIDGATSLTITTNQDAPKIEYDGGTKFYTV